MDERTRAYLRGRFRDHYRRVAVSPPPGANEREWGFIPWTASEGTTMVRHRSLLDLGDLSTFLQRKRPRHVYFSAGRYDDPGAGSMSAKGWRSSDLIFDLDADHLPSVDPEEATYGEMLAACKDALRRLLSFLEDDFGFSDLTVVFSGGRGYHVHVRDDGVLGLDSEQRREVVDYVRGNGLDFESLIDSESVAGLGRKTPAQKRTLDTSGGWSARAHRQVCALVDALLDAEEADAIARLREFDGVGEGKAAAALRAARENETEIRRGNVDVHPAFVTVARKVAESVVEADAAPIDEPVTTDTNRLIRLPGSLHGGSGLEVRRIDRDALDDFDPLVDAVPDTFVGQEIAVDVPPEAAGEVSLGGESFSIVAGAQTVPEHVGVFLMARGRAEKGKER